MDIYNIQKNDHQEFLLMLSFLENNATDSNSKVQTILSKLEREVLGHSVAEEETFYPRLLEKNKNLQKKMEESKKDHREIEDLFSTLKGLDKEDPQWGPNLQKLRQYLEDDIKLEETILIPEAENQFNGEEAENIAKDMISRKIELEDSVIRRMLHKISETAGQYTSRNDS